ARVLRKLAMLDVSIMGVYVITFCLGIYKKEGIIVSTRNGLIVLIAAEVVHTITFWLVSGAVEDAQASDQSYGYEVAPRDLDSVQPEEQGFNPICCLSVRRLGFLNSQSSAARTYSREASKP
ncbi:unnamed protein product, partial [Polarella glacialis]